MTENDGYTIRPAAEGDYDAIASIMRAVSPISDATSDELRRQDSEREAKYYLERLVAETPEGIVAHSSVEQILECYHPRKFFLSLEVDPGRQKQGIGSALYDAAMQRLDRFDPIRVIGRVSEDSDDSIRFAEQRGFSEFMREWKSDLDVAAVEIEDFIDRLNVLDRYGVAIKTYAELSGDPQHDQKLYELEMAVWSEMPAWDEFTPVSYEQYRKLILDDPAFLPDACFILLHNDRYLGLTNLFRRATDGDVYVNATGVLKEARRRGLAFALKVRALQFAKETGIARIYTENASTNRPMLSINECLGFKKHPARVVMAKDWGGKSG